MASPTLTSNPAAAPGRGALGKVRCDLGDARRARPRRGLSRDPPGLRDTRCQWAGAAPAFAAIDRYVRDEMTAQRIPGAKPSDGLEPSTPPYHGGWSVRRRVGGLTLPALFLGICAALAPRSTVAANGLERP
jgi:hypothetical protein